MQAAFLCMIPAGGTGWEWFHVAELKWLYRVFDTLPIMHNRQARMRLHRH